MLWHVLNILNREYRISQVEYLGQYWTPNVVNGVGPMDSLFDEGVLI